MALFVFLPFLTHERSTLIKVCIQLNYEREDISLYRLKWFYISSNVELTLLQKKKTDRFLNSPIIHVESFKNLIDFFLIVLRSLETENLRNLLVTQETDGIYAAQSIPENMLTFMKF